ncbi:hypothetical protein ACFE04_017177 [Oxalis oulophora]
MVRALGHLHSVHYKYKSFRYKRMLESSSPEGEAEGLIQDINDCENGELNLSDYNVQSGSGSDTNSSEREENGHALTRDKGPVMRYDTMARKPRDRNKIPTDTDIMKERFAKLLLGEDMSGGGKGVSSALAISNSITNIAASIFGEITKLEPVAEDRKARWRKEIDWILSVTDHIVEFVPSQTNNNGTNMEIMVTRQRNDLLLNIPALWKLDSMLLEVLDKFGNQNEFWYVSRDADDAEERYDDRWWLPTAKVPPSGLSEESRKMLQSQKDSVNQVLKAAMAINAQVLSEMEVPESYIESLPKHGRSSLGDSIYKSITLEHFNPDQFLSTMDLSTEHKVLDLKNRIEASIVIWKRKMNQKDGKSSWSSTVSLEKRELFEERAETIFMILKQQFPGISQSSLDICKIQYNKGGPGNQTRQTESSLKAGSGQIPGQDQPMSRSSLLSHSTSTYFLLPKSPTQNLKDDIGQSVLESYSRVLESLANTVRSRIEDILHADTIAQRKSLSCSTDHESSTVGSPASISYADQDTDTPNSITTLSDFMGWTVEQEEDNKVYPEDEMEPYFKGENDRKMYKPVSTPKKTSYLENIGVTRSPIARH